MFAYHRDCGLAVDLFLKTRIVHSKWAMPKHFIRGGQWIKLAKLVTCLQSANRDWVFGVKQSHSQENHVRNDLRRQRRFKLVLLTRSGKPEPCSFLSQEYVAYTFQFNTLVSFVHMRSETSIKRMFSEDRIPGSHRAAFRQKHKMTDFSRKIKMI